MSFHWFHVTLKGQHGEDMICARQCPSTQHQSRFELLVYILVDYVFWTEFRIQSIFWKGQHNLFIRKTPPGLTTCGLVAFFVQTSGCEIPKVYGTKKVEDCCCFMLFRVFREFVTLTWIFCCAQVGLCKQPLILGYLLGGWVAFMEHVNVAVLVVWINEERKSFAMLLLQGKLKAVFGLFSSCFGISAWQLCSFWWFETLRWGCGWTEPWIGPCA